MLTVFGTEELRMLWASVVLGLVQLTLAILAGIASGRLSWNLGARDQEGPPLGKIAGRVERALQNYLQTFPLFATAVLLTSILNRHNATTALGASLYFYARAAHVVIYALGIPVLRTLIWTVSIAGIVLILLGIWPGNLFAR